MARAKGTTGKWYGECLLRSLVRYRNYSTDIAFILLALLFAARHGSGLSCYQLEGDGTLKMATCASDDTSCFLVWAVTNGFNIDLQQASCTRQDSCRVSFGNFSYIAKALHYETG